MFKSCLNITLRDDSPSYECFGYPGGEWQVRLKGPVTADHVRVIARLQNAADILKLALLKNAIGNKPYTELILPYLPYSRADRAFVPNDCVGLDAFGSVINSMAWDAVVTLDAHNHIAAVTYIAALLDVPADLFIQRAIVEFAHKHQAKRITVLFPDEGARLRYYVLPPIIGSNLEIIELDVKQCEKVRNPADGKLLYFDLPPLDNSQPAIIVDDICDGGGTFVGIAQKAGVLNLGLYVTHGIFSRSLEVLFSYFDHIYTTDSFRTDYPAYPNLTVMTAVEEILRQSKS
jgi:ribose-phosphate pyrophosphokinase